VTYRDRAALFGLPLLVSIRNGATLMRWEGPVPQRPGAVL